MSLNTRLVVQMSKKITQKLHVVYIYVLNLNPLLHYQ